MGKLLFIYAHQSYLLQVALPDNQLKSCQMIDNVLSLESMAAPAL